MIIKQMPVKMLACHFRSKRTYQESKCWSQGKAGTVTSMAIVNTKKIIAILVDDKCPSVLHSYKSFQQHYGKYATLTWAPALHACDVVQELRSLPGVTNLPDTCQVHT